MNIVLALKMIIITLMTIIPYLIIASMEILWMIALVINAKQVQ